MNKSEAYMRSKWGEPKPTAEQLLEILIAEVRGLREELREELRKTGYTVTYEQRQHTPPSERPA